MTFAPGMKFSVRPVPAATPRAGIRSSRWRKRANGQSEDATHSPRRPHCRQRRRRCSAPPPASRRRATPGVRVVSIPGKVGDVGRGVGQENPDARLGDQPLVEQHVIVDVLAHGRPPDQIGIAAADREERQVQRLRAGAPVADPGVVGAERDGMPLRLVDARFPDRPSTLPSVASSAERTGSRRFRHADGAEVRRRGAIDDAVLQPLPDDFLDRGHLVR